MFVRCKKLREPKSNLRHKSCGHLPEIKPTILLAATHAATHAASHAKRTHAARAGSAKVEAWH